MKRKLLSIGINECSYNDFLHKALALPERKASSYVCFANVHMVVECHWDSSYRSVINNADLVAPDGRPIGWLLRLASGKHQDQISGPDLFEDLLRACADRNKSVFFYGSTPEVLESLAVQMDRRFPSLQIRGSFSPPFRDLQPHESAKIIDMINEASADFILVALGCPKQEKWMAANQGKIKGCMLGVGQAFQIHAGTLKRAPRWMQRAGLEWVFRLYMDPVRLWKRYIYTNAYFVYLILRYRLSGES